MRIEKLFVENLHGYISGGVNLNRDLNILYGRNGSGKTTALNLIRSILNFDLQAVMGLAFDYIVLTFIDGESRGKIEISRNENSGPVLNVNGTSCDVEKFISLSRRGADRDVWLMFDSISKTLTSKANAEMKQLSELIVISEKIKARANITLVNIDRTMYVTNSEGDVAVDIGVKKGGLSKGASRQERDPLDVVQVYCAENYARFASENNQIKTKFINDLMISFLEWEKHKSSTSDRQVTASEVDELETKFRELGLFDGGASDRVLKKFFTDARKIASELSAPPAKPRAKGRKTIEEEFESKMKLMSLTRVSNLLTSINQMEMKIREARAIIDKYLLSINSFFKATGKEMFFNAEDNKLHFRFLALPSDVRDLRELSSGERQVIIVLTYLYFAAKQDSIFIVDEPELSLHLAWQKKFVAEMKALAPSNCQIILASHSPEIVGGHRYAIQPVFAIKSIGG